MFHTLARMRCCSGWCCSKRWLRIAAGAACKRCVGRSIRAHCCRYRCWRLLGCAPIGQCVCWRCCSRHRWRCCCTLSVSSWRNMPRSIHGCACGQAITARTRSKPTGLHYGRRATCLGCISCLLTARCELCVCCMARGARRPTTPGRWSTA